MACFLAINQAIFKIDQEFFEKLIKPIELHIWSKFQLIWSIWEHSVAI